MAEALARKKSARTADEKQANITVEGIDPMVLGDPDSVSRVQEQLELYIGTNFSSEQAQFLRTGVLLTLPIPDIGRIDTLYPALAVVDRNKMKLDLCMKHNDRQEKFDVNYQQIFNLLIKILDKPGRDKLRSHPEFPPLRLEGKKVDLLWKLILKVYSTGTSLGSGDIHSDRARAQAEYTNYCQGDNTSLLDFKVGLTTRKLHYETMCGVVVGTEAHVYAFISRLNRGTYGRAAADLLQYISAGAIPLPTSIDEAHAKISQMQPNAPIVRQDRGHKSTTFAAAADDSDSSEDGERFVRDLSKTECFNCHELGHMRRDCPKKKGKKKKEKKDKIAYTVNHGAVFAAFEQGYLKATDAVLDSGSNVHLCNNKDFCNSITEVAEQLERVGGATEVSHRGVLPYFGKCIIADHRVSLISLGRVESSAKDVLYVKGVSFTVVWADDSTTTFKFIKQCKLYVCDMYNFVNANKNQFAYSGVSTVADNRIGYTAHDLKKADNILSLQRKMGYASSNDMIRLINGGGIMHFDATSADVINCEKIHGPNHIYLKGAYTDSGAVGTLSQEHCPTMKCPQVLHTDVFYFDGVSFLVSVAKPMNLILSNKLDSRSIDKDIRMQLEQQISLMAERGCPIQTVFGDGEFKPLHNATIHGAIVYATASSEPTAERTGGVLKNRVRSLIASIPWKVPPSMMEDLVTFATMMINWTPRLGGIGPSARQVISGNKLDYRELKAGCGDYVQAYDKNLKRKNDVTTSHTMGCIALYPLFNGKGSWRLLNITTQERITSDNFKILPTSDDVIVRMNEIAATQVAARTRAGRRGANQAAADAEPVQQIIPEILNQEVIDGMEQPIIPDDPRVEIFPEVAPKVVRFADEDNIETMSDDVAMFCFGQMSTGESMKKYPEMTVAGGIKEVKQILDKNVLDFIRYKSLTREEKQLVIPSHITCKPKMEGDVVVEIKERLVGGGNKQVRKEFDDFYSSTIKTSSVMTLLAEAASKKLQIKSMDIEGAYLEASMDDTIVHMRLSKKVSAMFIKQRPGLKKYLHHGSLYARLNKALYGIIQAALKWKEKLSGELLTLGYTQCTEDDCVFFKMVEGNMMKVGVYVDDLLFSHKVMATIDKEILAIGSRFAGYKQSDGINFKFLGMRIARNSNMDVMVSMKDYTKKICAEHNIDFTCTLPAKSDLFAEDDSPLISESERTIFHTGAAQCLYLSKRVRCDILVNTSFLSGRVVRATKKNQDQLYQLMCYLYGTMNRGIIYRGGGSMEPEVYGDASFMIHEDTRSRGGDLVILSGGVILAHSSKQTIITKSSTEAELVNLDDTVVSALGTRRLLLALGEPDRPTRVHQDNNSVLGLVKRGKPISQRTKHISMRYFSVCEHIKDKEIEVVWCSTHDMLADILTKQLAGKVFKKMRNILAPIIEDKYL